MATYQGQISIYRNFTRSALRGRGFDFTAASGMEVKAMLVQGTFAGQLGQRTGPVSYGPATSLDCSAHEVSGAGTYTTGGYSLGQGTIEYRTGMAGLQLSLANPVVPIIAAHASNSINARAWILYVPACVDVPNIAIGVVYMNDRVDVDMTVTPVGLSIEQGAMQVIS